VAPSRVSKAMASAFSSHKRSRRAGVLTWTDPIPMPKRRSLVSRNPHSMPQRLPYRLFQEAGRRISEVGGQAPSLLHVLIPYAQHGPPLIAFGRHRSATQQRSASAGADPANGGAFVSICAGHGHVATEADDVIELQRLGQKPVELLITEAAIGHDRHLDTGWQCVGQPDKRLIFILVSMVLERGGVDREPYQRGGAAVPGHQRQHDGGLAIGVEVGPVHRYLDAGTRPHDGGNPVAKCRIDVRCPGWTAAGPPA
jgi:hypothetical protein